MYKVLLVDDEPAIMEAERRTISRHSDSFTVCGEAFSVEQAIRLIEEQRPQVVLTDMKMPKQNGTELIRSIGRLEDQMIVSVAVSGYSDFAYVHDAFSYGAYDYLLKPVEPRKLTELLGRIRELLDHTSEKPVEKSGMHTGRMTEEETAEEIIRYISDHLREDNSIVRICTRFAINQPYLSRIFRKVKAVPIMTI